jgi:hypothetical protein
MAAQAVLGYVQYAQQIPAVLVGFHVFGAVCVFISVQWLVFEIRIPALRAVRLRDDAPVDAVSTAVARG